MLLKIYAYDYRNRIQSSRRPAGIAKVVLLHRGLAGATVEASPQVFLLVAPSLVPSPKLDGLIRSASGVSLTV